MKMTREKMMHRMRYKIREANEKANIIYNR